MECWGLDMIRLEKSFKGCMHLRKILRISEFASWEVISTLLIKDRIRMNLRKVD